MFLDELVARKQLRVSEKKKTVPLETLKKRIAGLAPARNFKGALQGDDVALIAEVKKASPSKGIIRSAFDPVEIARVYETSGAKAISVLTEEEHFLGGFEYLSLVKEATSVPVLCKDFIFDPYQIYEARARGADAVLLIKAIINQKELRHLYLLAQELGLDPLVEAHSEDELHEVLDAEAEIVGINNRNLYTFDVDLSVTVALAKLVPDDKILVSESGIGSRDDVELVKRAGVNAILVGESLLRAADIGAKIRELIGEQLRSV